MKDSAKAERRDRAEKGKRVLFERESLALNQHEQEDDDDDDDSGAKRCLRYFEYVVYCVGQVCATVVLIFVSCVCFSKMSHLTAVHAWLSTFGFVFILTQGILIYCISIFWPTLLHRRTIHFIHIGIQVTGFVIGTAGMLVMIYAKGFRYGSIHSILGVMTFMACLCTAVFGAGFYLDVNRRPWFSIQSSKRMHLLCAIFVSVVAYCTLLFGYNMSLITDRVQPSVLLMLKIVSMLTLVFLFFPLQTFFMAWT